MHEMGVAMEVCRVIESRVGLEAAHEVVTVDLEVGDDSGVDLESLHFCLEAALAEPPFAGATPVLHRARGDVLRINFLEVDDERAPDRRA